MAQKDFLLSLVWLTVRSFALDRDEVAVGRFRAFAAEYAGPVPAGSGQNPNNPTLTGWDPSWNSKSPADAASLVASLKCNIHATWTDEAGAAESMPINCVSWYEAFAFCAWDGGWLPSEVQWQYAASGGDEQRLYPWGDAPPSPMLAIYACPQDAGAPPDCSMLLPVGSRPAGVARWGQLDLAGSLIEWVFDNYAEPVHDPYPFLNPCDDCEDTGATQNRVQRGGSWTGGADSLANTSRDFFQAAPPAGNEHFEGFRCARSE